MNGKCKMNGHLAREVGGGS